MNEPENAFSSPKPKVRGPQKAPKREFCLKIYLTEAELTSFCEEAAKAGFRNAARKLFKAKPHGFANEREVDMGGIAAFVRERLFPDWKQGEVDRLLEIAELDARARKRGCRVITIAEAEKLLK